MNKSIKRLLAFILVTIITSSQVFGASYIYKVDKESSSVEKIAPIESSISTSLTLSPPEFNFQSVSQILIEPTTGTVLYANNENERLLPASVTKVMTY